MKADSLDKVEVEEVVVLSSPSSVSSLAATAFVPAFANHRPLCVLAIAVIHRHP